MFVHVNVYVYVHVEGCVSVDGRHAHSLIIVQRQQTTNCIDLTMLKAASNSATSSPHLLLKRRKGVLRGRLVPSPQLLQGVDGLEGRLAGHSLGLRGGRSGARARIY